MTKSKLQILKIRQNFKFLNFETSIVEDTERTRFCPRTDRRTDGQGDTSIPPYQLRWSGGYKYLEMNTLIMLVMFRIPSM